MKNGTTIKIMLGLLLAVVLFHLCILTKIIPYGIAWGGRLQNDSEMYVFETISILINFFLGFVLLMKGGQIKPYLNKSTIHVVLWLFLILFVINTIGNIFSKTLFEKSFSILTLLFAFLIWLILKNKMTDNAKNDEGNTF